MSVDLPFGECQQTFLFSDVKKEKKDKHFIKKPIYPGGTTAFQKFIRENLRYPKEALEKRIEGTVRVRYEIDYKGNVVNGKVLAGIGHGCDEEAIRLVKLLKFEVPPLRKGKVSFHKTTNVNFKLKKIRKKTISVEYKPEPKDTHKKKESSSEKTTYTYTIRW